MDFQEFILRTNTLSKTGKSIEDYTELVNLCIEVLSELNQKKYSKFSSKQIGYLYNTKKEQYRSFNIKKKSGGNRRIDAPKSKLKFLQKINAAFLEISSKSHKNAHGFIRRKSIVTNASNHIGKKLVFNCDLKDFFPSVHYGRILGLLQAEPISFSQNIAHFFAHFSTKEKVLPQGSPTSPILTNLVSQRLDRKLTQFSNDNFSSYSRYVDDITFSSNKYVFDDDFKKELNEIIIGEGFLINPEKTRLQRFSQSQEVTGIKVNKKCNISRDKVRKIRAILNNWEKKGYDLTQKNLNSKYNKDVRSQKIVELSNYVKGNIDFMEMVRGRNDEIVLKLKNQFLILSNGKR